MRRAALSTEAVGGPGAGHGERRSRGLREALDLRAVDQVGGAEHGVLARAELEHAVARQLRERIVQLVGSRAGLLVTLELRLHEVAARGCRHWRWRGRPRGTDSHLHAPAHVRELPAQLLPAPREQLPQVVLAA